MGVAHTAVEAHTEVAARMVEVVRMAVEVGLWEVI